MKPFLRSTIASLIAIVSMGYLYSPAAEADETPGISASSVNQVKNATPNEPTQLVLNQSYINGIPMTTQPENWPNIVSQAAVVMDMNTGTIVYAKNPEVEHYPASITKIMTAMLALEDGKLTDMVPVSKNAADQPPDKLYFVPGESEPLLQMLYGLMLISANDAAVAIAEDYGGSVSGFAKMMNAKAKALGATHTHFDNPNGLPDPNHVSTAYDMALITKAAMQIPEFRKIVSTRTYHWKGEAWQSQLYNINHMLFTYPGSIGVKTGYTSVAHETLVVAATRGNTTFLAVLMDNPTNYSIMQDATQLLNFAFDHYQTDMVVQKGTVVDELRSPDGSMVPLYATENVVATVDKAHPPAISGKLHLRALPPATLNLGAMIGSDTRTPESTFLQAAASVPVQQNAWLHVGNLTYSLADEPSVTLPLFAQASSFAQIASLRVHSSHPLSVFWLIPGGVGMVLIIVFLLSRRRKSRARICIDAVHGPES